MNELPSDEDFPQLDPERYQRVVALPLKVCATIAARRGDAALINDMPAMLALMRQINLLAGCCGEMQDDLALALAARGACVMALREAGLPEAAVADCLDALERASEQLAEADIFTAGDGDTLAAWPALEAERVEEAEKWLNAGAMSYIAAIEEWEKNRLL